MGEEETRAACQAPDPSTKDFIFQQTMFRIKDPKASLAFYTGVLGMRLLKKLDFPDMKFSLYFLGFVPASAIPTDEKERTRWCFSQPFINVGLRITKANVMIHSQPQRSV